MLKLVPESTKSQFHKGLIEKTNHFKLSSLRSIFAPLNDAFRTLRERVSVETLFRRKQGRRAGLPS